MMELMKFDMGGAGAVLGAAQIISDLKPEGVEVWLHLLITPGAAHQDDCANFSGAFGLFAHPSAKLVLTHAHLLRYVSL